MRKRKAKFRSSRLRIRKKRRRIIALKVTLYLILTAGLIYSLSYLSSTKILTIDRVEIVGNKVLEEQTLRNLVETEIEGRVLGLFPKKNIFLYPKRSIINKLIGRFERLSSVDVDLKSFKVLEVRVVERGAVAVWCSEPTSEERNDQSELVEELLVDKATDQKETLIKDCYLVDNTGLIFASYSSSTPSSLPRYEGENLGDVSIGSYFWKRRDAKKVSEFLSSLDSLKVEILKITKEPERKVVIILNTETDLILSLNDDWPRAFENLATLVSEPEFKEYVGDNLLSPFAYIDLRFKNKLLYKLK
jgi:hypothetical protein